MIALHHGRRQSLAKLREMAGTDRRGTNVAGLLKAAHAIGFNARGVRAAAEALPEIPLPAIAHWKESNRSHFVVVYRFGKAITIADPAAGIRKLTREEFLLCWTGVLVLLTPDRLTKAETSDTPVSRFYRLLAPHRWIFLEALLAAVLMTLLTLFSSFFIQTLVDFVFVAGRRSTLNWLALGMLLVLVARVAFQGLRAYLLAHLSQRLDAETVIGYFRHLLGLPLSFFNARRTGEILSRMSDGMKIRAAIGATTLSVVVDALFIGVTAAIMLMMHWRLALLTLAVLPVLAVSTWLFNRPMKRSQRRAMEKAAELEAQLVEVVGSPSTVKALQLEPVVESRVEARFLEMADSVFRAQLLGVHNSAASAFLVGVSALVLLWYGGSQVLVGELTIGQLMGLHSMLGMILGPVERLANANQSIQDGLIAAERFSEVLDLDQEFRDEASTARDRPLQGAIEFRDVRIQYGSRPPVIERFTHHIRAGECLAICGPSGSGKTSLVLLLGRLFEPAAGQILLDDIPIQHYDLRFIRREVGFVLQDAAIFNASIAENIHFGRLDATPEQVRQAAAAARVDAFVSQLPEGYNTIAGERGVLLSGGQRQRILLARAILKDPAILVLDEPTNHLDAESELALHALLESRRGRKTTIVISHKPLPVDGTVELDSHATAGIPAA